MTLHMKIGSALTAGALVLVAGMPAAQAQLSPDKLKCFETVAKAGGKFVAKKLKAIQQCNDASLSADPGDDCVAGEPAATIAALVITLNATIDSKCVLTAPEIEAMGFPGKCPDPNTGDGFTEPDLKSCIYDTHENTVDDLIDIEYGTTSGALADDVLTCQRTIAKNGAKFVNTKLKAVQKCRNRLNKGTLIGLAPSSCETADSKTHAKIVKAESKARAAIFKKCTDPDIGALDVCNPNAMTESEAEDCIIATHESAVDATTYASPANLIDYEYADPLSCGDNILNSTLDIYDFSEECDGTAAAACPGMCGPATGPFPCLCLDKKRQRVIEHANADSDNGWTGISHDAPLVEGGGYLADLYDCDGPGGPDTVCTVGPSCTIEDPPLSGIHAPCANNGACGVHGPCRKERTAAGPHCNFNVQQACTNNTNCPGIGNFCVKTYHGPPLPLSAGGTSVCVENVFTEDVFGTANVATGAASMRYHQDTINHLGPTANRPCPTCGGFCGAPPNGDRRPCTTNADCVAVSGSPACVTDRICSGGANIDKPCRPEFPFGGTNPLFGTTSVDCLPNSLIVANLDLTFSNRTTGTVTLLPGILCDEPAFANKVCMGGANNGRPCTMPSECASGNCSHQCFCPVGGSQKESPNACYSACLGGANDANGCIVDSECPLGFCHKADCRSATGICQGGTNEHAPCTDGSECPGGTCGDPDGDHEGVCSAGPLDSYCSVNKEKSCDVDADCGGFECPFCQPGETCVTKFRECFENTGIIRTGVADPADPTTVIANCSGPASSGAVNSVSGLPGPTAQRFPEHRVNTGF